MKHSFYWMTILLGLCVNSVGAESTPMDRSKLPANGDYELRRQIAARLPGADVSKIEFLSEAGLYEVQLPNRIVYATADGKYLLTGELMNLTTKENITGRHKAARNGIELNTVKDEDTIVFAPSGAAKHTITVFTDVDCAYCRKLHADISALNERGIKVRYVSFPRAGENSESWMQAESVWCAADRKAALTRAKKGEKFKSQACANPVAAQFELGKRVGVPATPAIFTENGTLVAGYAPPEILVKRLDDLKK